MIKDNEKECMKTVQSDINQALDEIKEQNYDLYVHLKKHIVFDKEKNTVCYSLDETIDWK